MRLGLGSNVSKASLHNLSIMENLPWTDMETEDYVKGKIMIGSKARVYLANMIIPQVASIKNYEGDIEVEIPKVCPVCGAPTKVIVNNGVKTLYCTGKECDAQITGKLMNTFSKDGLFVQGLGESQIDDLLSERLVDETTLSFYTLRYRTENNVAGAGDRARSLRNSGKGWGQKKWDNLLNAIDASRKTTVKRLLYSLNIPLLGNDLSKKIAEYWKNDPKAILRACSYAPAYSDELTEELMLIDGVGEEKARNITDWCVDTGTSETEYTNLSKLINELEFPEKSEAKESTLSGLTFVITGAVHNYKNRDEFKASVEARGGKVAGSVSAKTSFLVNNDVTSTSGKNQKAKELGIEIISEDEFIKRFGK